MDNASWQAIKNNNGFYLLAIFIIIISMILLFSFIFGYMIASWFAGQETGKPGRLKSIRLSFRNYIIHFHHWFIAGLIALILGIIDFQRSYFYAFLLGIIIHGMTYDDFYHLVHKNKPSKNEVRK